MYILSKNKNGKFFLKTKMELLREKRFHFHFILIGSVADSVQNKNLEGHFR